MQMQRPRRPKSDLHWHPWCLDRRRINSGKHTPFPFFISSIAGCQVLYFCIPF
jgi:hypothetical protein